MNDWIQVLLFFVVLYLAARLVIWILDGNDIPTQGVYLGNIEDAGKHEE
jgi:hypothetical protein